MEKLILQMLIFLSSLIILFALSVPLHEFFHFLPIKVLGGKIREGNKMTWFKLNFHVSKGKFMFSMHGGGKIDAFFPDYLKKHLRAVAFLTGLSGGLGTAIVFVGIVFLLFFLGSLPDILDWISTSFLIIAIFHLFYGMEEAVRVYNEVELIEE